MQLLASFSVPNHLLNCSWAIVNYEAANNVLYDQLTFGFIGFQWILQYNFPHKNFLCVHKISVLRDLKIHPRVLLVFSNQNVIGYCGWLVNGYVFMIYIYLLFCHNDVKQATMLLLNTALWCNVVIKNISNLEFIDFPTWQGVWNIYSLT